jgi:hypothetical protein
MQILCTDLLYQQPSNVAIDAACQAPIFTQPKPPLWSLLVLSQRPQGPVLALFRVCI